MVADLPFYISKFEILVVYNDTHRPTCDISEMITPIMIFPIAHPMAMTRTVRK